MSTVATKTSTPSPTTPALELRGLGARYGPVTVLRDIDLAVGKSQVVALLGPNGAGKTTLMRVAAGLVPARGGEVVLNGHDITSDRADKRAKTGLCMIPEGRGIFPALSVRENLRLQGPARQQQETLERIVTAFPILGERLSQRAGSLSGGQQQMVALGRCLSNDPSVVMLDEVSMGLAPLIVDQIFEVLEGLAAVGISLLLVEQYVSKALAMADLVYVLDRGQIKWSGSPDEISQEEIMQLYLAGDMTQGHEPSAT